MEKPGEEPGDVRGTSSRVRNRLGFVGGAAAWAGQGGGFGDAGMCWTWLGPGFGSAELVVAEGRAGGSAAVLGLPAAGSVARAAFLCASGLGSYPSRALFAWQGK